jgi:lantibiotic modifying enzyme
MYEVSHRALKEIINQVLMNETFEYTGLLEGLAGESLLLIEYSRLTNHNNIESATDKRIDLLVTSLHDNFNKINSQSTFYHGNAGIIWLLKYIQHNYGYELDDESCSIIDNYCFSKAKCKFLLKDFDFFSGGIGYSIPLIYDEAKISICTEYLINGSTIDSSGNRKWETELIDNKHGQFLGLAHGISSILSFLTITQSENNTLNLYRYAYDIINYLKKNKVNNELNIYPTYKTNRDEYSHNTRLAWCHGDLGIAAAIFNAGVTFNKKEWLDEAYDILHHIYTKRTNLEQNGIYDANICHGAAGVAHIFNKVYQYSKIPEFKKATDLWVEHTLYFAKYEDGVAGFKTMDNERGLINSTGLLTGISGIGLVLLSYLYPETVNTWDRCLLLS